MFNSVSLTQSLCCCYHRVISCVPCKVDFYPVSHIPTVMSFSTVSEPWPTWHTKQIRRTIYMYYCYNFCVSNTIQPVNKFNYSYSHCRCRMCITYYCSVLCRFYHFPNRIRDTYSKCLSVQGLRNTRKNVDHPAGNSSTWQSPILCHQWGMLIDSRLTANVILLSRYLIL